MSKPKYPVKFMEQKLSQKNTKYLKLTNDITVHGYTKKDGTKTPDVLVKKGTFVELVKCPTDEDIIAAENGPGGANFAKVLENRRQYWGGQYPESLLAEFHVKPDQE